MFKNEVAEFIYKRTYSRWLEDENRREDWPETIERLITFLISKRPDIPDKTIIKLRKYMMEFAVCHQCVFFGPLAPQLISTIPVYIIVPLLRLTPSRLSPNVYTY